MAESQRTVHSVAEYILLLTVKGYLLRLGESNIFGDAEENSSKLKFVPIDDLSFSRQR